MPRGKKNENPFADVPEEYRETAQKSTPDEIKAMIAQVALNQAALEEAQSLDEDLENLKAQVSSAMEPYKLGKKANSLKTKFLRSLLGDKGADTGDDGLEASPDADSDVQAPVQG